MNSRRLRVALPVVLVVLVVFVAACDTETTERREMFLRTPIEREGLDAFSEPMIRNAAAYNMVVADGHFFPHTSELNGLGTKQLDHISVSLERFNGTVHYETRSKDEDLIAKRLDNIKQYLTDTGIDTTSIAVTASLSGGRTILATDAIAAKLKAGEANSDSGTTSANPQAK